MQMTTKSSDPYRILGVKRGAGQDEIRKAYFRQVREHPPESDPETFKAIRSAYEQLRSAEQRAVSDLYLLQPPPPWPAGGTQERPCEPWMHVLGREDVLAILRALTDLERDEFKDDYRPVRL